MAGLNENVNQAHSETMMGTLGLVLVGVLSTTVLVTLPILASAMGRQIGASPQEVGYLASSDMLGSAAASLTAPFWIRAIRWRHAVILSLIGVVIGNGAAIFADSLWPLLSVRFFVGACNGFILSIVFVGLCHTKVPDRSFGIYVFAQLVLQSILLPWFANLETEYGITPLYLILAAVPFLIAICIPTIPNQMRAQEGDFSKFTLNAKIWAMITLVALGVYFLAPAVVWGYFEPIGKTFDIDANAIGEILGQSALAGIAGAAVVLLLAGRLSQSLSITLGIAMSVGSVVMMLGGSGYMSFLICCCLFNFAWNFTFPYLMGVIALYDEDGQTAIFSLASQILGLALGPSMGAALLTINGGFGPIYIAVFVIYAISLVAFLLAKRNAQTKLSAN